MRVKIRDSLARKIETLAKNKGSKPEKEVEKALKKHIRTKKEVENENDKLLKQINKLIRKKDDVSSRKKERRVEGVSIEELRRRYEERKKEEREKLLKKWRG